MAELNNFYALLIGVDRYEPNPYYKDLKGQRHGALTYWMIDTLTSSTSVLTYKSLYNRVKGMIQSEFPQQLPMLIGDSDRLVFGDRRQYKPYTVVVIDVAEDGTAITLDAGLAAGLTSGTRFAIYPVEVNDFSDKTKQIAIAELTDDIEADKSKAKILSRLKTKSNLVLQQSSLNSRQSLS